MFPAYNLVEGYSPTFSQRRGGCKMWLDSKNSCPNLLNVSCIFSIIRGGPAKFKFWELAEFVSGQFLGLVGSDHSAFGPGLLGRGIFI